MPYNWNLTYLDYHQLGSRVRGNTLFISVLLPLINNAQYSVRALIVKESEFYDTQKITAHSLDYLPNSSNQEEGIWNTEITVSNWKTGTYLYWFHVKRLSDGAVFDSIVDPFAREFGFGKYSAFTIGLPSFIPTAASYEKPSVSHSIIYEIHLQEFGNTIDGCIQKLDYLADLGINAILLMPIHNVSDQVNWGYLPLGYFGVDERFGNRRDFQKFVDECHKRKISVVLDVVFAHTSQDIAFNKLYRSLGLQSPLSGNVNTWGGAIIDYSKSFAKSFVKSAIASLKENFGIDGFRFDYVAGYWDSYPEIVEFAESQFAQDSQASPLLMAELLWDSISPQQAFNTSSNICYQNGTFSASTSLAESYRNHNYPDGHALWQLGYNHFSASDFQNIPGKLPLQYIENHDHKRFVCNFYGSQDEDFNFILDNADATSPYRQDYGYRVQPYLIGLLLCKGVPLLWQGQELCENYWVIEDLWKNSSISRVKVYRNVRWEYCLDSIGRNVHNLVKKLIEIRKNNMDSFGDGGYRFYNDYEKYQSRGILAFKRYNNIGEEFLVVLNFNDYDVDSIQIPNEFINATSILGNSAQGSLLKVSSNYGVVLKINV